MAFSNSEFFFQLNTGQFNSSFAGADHRIQRAWIQGLTGCGVTVAVVDDGNRNSTPIFSVSIRARIAMDGSCHPLPSLELQKVMMTLTFVHALSVLLNVSKQITNTILKPQMPLIIHYYKVTTSAYVSQTAPDAISQRPIFLRSSLYLTACMQLHMPCCHSLFLKIKFAIS